MAPTSACSPRVFWRLLVKPPEITHTTSSDEKSYCFEIRLASGPAGLEEHDREHNIETHQVGFQKKCRCAAEARGEFMVPISYFHAALQR